jgi:[ribosomal protein S5]-alanine N-acetyltransferase
MIRLNLPEKIETERLVLQRLRYEDAEEIFYTYASKPEVTRYLAFPTHQSVGDARNFLEYVTGAWDRGTEYAFGIRLKGENRFIGSIGFINDEGKVQFGYGISPNFWNKGLTTEACQAVLKLLKGQKDIHRIWTFTDAENVASGKVLLKCGLVEEARLTKWFRFINQDNQPKDCILYVLKG